MQAKTSIPGLGKPITAVDVTYDARWILATTDDYLIVVKTTFDDGAGEYMTSWAAVVGDVNTVLVDVCGTLRLSATSTSVLQDPYPGMLHAYHLLSQLTSGLAPQRQAALPRLLCLKHKYTGFMPPPPLTGSTHDAPARPLAFSALSHSAQSIP